MMEGVPAKAAAVVPLSTWEGSKITLIVPISSRLLLNIGAVRRLPIMPDCSGMRGLMTTLISPRVRI